MELTHAQFLDKYLRTAQKEPWFPTAECVGLAKLYIKEVFGIQLWTFWGTARSGWYNKSKTFDKKWEKIPYKVGIVPKQGDVIFYDTGISWHVAIVENANKIDITVVEQNWFSRNGSGKGFDSIMLETKRDYKDVLGWYRLK